MARKLSALARRITHDLVVTATGLVAITLRAQAETPTADAPKVISNPFAAGQSGTQSQPALQSSAKLQTVTEPSQKVHRRPITYQNPFAAASKSPPVDTSLRPGPISRWRRPVLPGQTSSGVKSALLATPAGEPATRTWDQLPPAEDLRTRVASRSPETDPTFYSRLTTSPEAIQFTPKTLIQPNWLTQFDESAVRVSAAPPNEATVTDTTVNAAGLASQTSAQSPASHISRAEQVNRAFALDVLDTSTTKANVSPSIISDCVDTPVGWLEQAQHAARNASSVEELSSIIESCDRGLRSGPDEKLLSSLRRLCAWAHNRRGELLADAEQSDAALNDFQASISLDPECSLAIHNRAVSFAQQNQFDAALRDFNRVIELNPGLAVAYRNRAELLAAIGRMHEAVSDYKQALESLPNDAQLYRDRAYAYQHLGDFSKAMADFNRALEIAPDDPDALTQRGNLAAEEGNYDQAVADFQQALVKDANWAEAHRSLAWLAATCPNSNYQNPQEAIAGAERAAKLAPDNDYTIFETLAAAHASAGNFSGAVNFQRRAIACAPPELTQTLNQRLTLYQSNQAFRNVSGSDAKRGNSAKTDEQSNLPVGALR